MTLQNQVVAIQERINKSFDIYLGSIPVPSAPLLNVVNYSLRNGGKRLRPLLVYLTGQALGASLDKLDAPAAAIELIHTYSLIHDDLPSMDNAEIRRGQPSCHVAFNEALAILAGDALQPLAFEILATHPCGLTADQRISMVHVLSVACGIQGMAAGQSMDLAKVNSLAELTQMYQLKTGALLDACVKLGAIAADVNNKLIHEKLETFAECIGLAFQIQDDLLDIESDAETLGKPVELDQANQKITYPSLIGVEQSRQKIEDLFNHAIAAVECLEGNGKLLQDFAFFLLQRNN